MSTKYLVPLCAAAALLVACGTRDSGQATGSDSANDSAGSMQETPTTPETDTYGTPADPGAYPDSTYPDSTTPDTTTPGTTTTPGNTPPADSPDLQPATPPPPQ